MARVRPDPHRSQKRQQAQVFIPPDRYNFEVKVEVITQNDGTIDLMNYNSTPFVTGIQITKRSLMRGLNDAVVTIQNPLGTFNNVITKGDTIKIYAEYLDDGETPTLVQFRGRIDAFLKSFDMQNGFYATLYCRQLNEVQDRRISENFIEVPGHQVISTAIDNWFSSTVTYSNMSTNMTTILTRQYVFKLGHEIIRDVFDKCSYTGYIDGDNDIHSWSLDSPQQNDSEFIAYGINCNAVAAYGDDLRKSKNNVVASGDRVEGQGELFYIWSKKDSSDINTTWQRDEIINDNAINSQNAIENEAALAYEKYTRSDPTGHLVSETYGLETLQTGESIPCYIPHCDINGYFIVHELTHNILPAQGKWNTSVNLEKFGVNIIDYFKTRNERSKGNILGSANTNGMIGAFCITFQESSPQVEHSNTEIINSGLQLQDGFGTGTATSILKNVDDDITAIEIKLRGEDLGASTVDVTVDNEELWETNVGFDTGNEYTITSTSTNKKRLKFRMNLVTDSDNANPRILSASCMFRY